MSDPLLDVLLPAIPGEKQQEITQYDGLQSYLDHVRTIPQASIGLERQHLEKSAESTKTTLASLAHTYHEQIARGAKSVNQFTVEFGAFRTAANQLYSVQLADAQDLTNMFQKNNATTTSSDSLSESEGLLILKNLERIQDILEIPTLALACVRNGYYSEALDLASHVKRLVMRFNNIAVIASIQTDMEGVLEVMQLQLIQQLCENIKLPTQIKTIGYLRRMRLPGVHSQNPSDPSSINSILQHLYLISRLGFIRSLYSSIEPLKQSSPDKYLKKYIEFFREHVFSTISGFQPIFGSDPDARLLSEFLRSAISELFDVLVELGPQITDASTRSSLWLQLAYCSQSLGRVGGEFWPSLQSREASPISDEEWDDTIKKRQEISQRLGQIMGS